LMIEAPDFAIRMLQQVGHASVVAHGLLPNAAAQRGPARRDYSEHL
jgi:hypothetical protein